MFKIHRKIGQPVVLAAFLHQWLRAVLGVNKHDIVPFIVSGCVQYLLGRYT